MAVKTEKKATFEKSLCFCLENVCSKMAPFCLHLFNQGLCYSSREISLEVDGLRKICLYCLKVLILVQFLL